jgi:hypothetical protein
LTIEEADWILLIPILNILGGFELDKSCLLLKLWKYGDSITKYIRFIIFRVSEPPQYIAVAHIGGKIGDMVVYRN